MELWIWSAWHSRHSILFWIYYLKNEAVADNLPMQLCVNRIKNRIVSKINTDYRLALLAPEITKLLQSTKKDADKDKDGEDVQKFFLKLF